MGASLLAGFVEKYLTPYLDSVMPTPQSVAYLLILVGTLAFGLLSIYKFYHGLLYDDD